MNNKVIPIEEAVELVAPGDGLALGGITLYRRPFSFIRSLISLHLSNNSVSDLTLMAFTASLESDLLIGAGMVSQVRTCYFGLEIFGLAPMFTHHANRGEIEIIEETEASLAFGLRAQIAGVGFMPGRGWIGTDLLKLRPDVKTIRDPYLDEELVAFPAIHPDVAVIHALKADYDGNALVGEHHGVDEELSLASKTVIITAEEVLPKIEKADIVGPLVNAVVHAPHGAFPSSCHPIYALDGETYLKYSESVSDPASFIQFLDTWL